MSEQETTAVVDGVDVDAVAAATVGGRHVRGLVGRTDGDRIATYLPGRVVDGIRVEDDRVLISVEIAWDSSAVAVAEEITTAVAGLIGARRVDVAIAAIADPGQPESLPRLPAAQPTMGPRHPSS